MDAQRIPRMLQAPLLLTVFMVGPVGLLLIGGALLALRAAPLRFRAEHAAGVPA